MKIFLFKNLANFGTLTWVEFLPFRAFFGFFKKISSPVFGLKDEPASQSTNFEISAFFACKSSRTSQDMDEALHTDFANS